MSDVLPREESLAAVPPVPPVPPAPRAPAAERGLGDYARALWAGRRTVLVAMLATAAVAAALSFVLPPQYEAVTLIIPVPTTRGLSGIEQLAARGADLRIGVGGQQSSALMYPEIVKSRHLLETVLMMMVPGGPEGQDVPLIDIVQRSGRGLRRTELAVKKLRENVDAVLNRRTGVLSIRVRARSPKVASHVANALYTLLQDFVVNSTSTQAGANCRFIEGRLKETRADLASAENRLRGFREDNLRIGNSPRLLLRQARLVRGVRTQEEIFLTLTRRYELAKVDEQRDVPVLNVLDTATTPASRSSPKRGRMVLFGLILGTVMGAGLVLARPRFAKHGGCQHV